MMRKTVILALLAGAVALTLVAAPAIAQCEVVDVYQSVLPVDPLGDWDCAGDPDDRVWTNCDNWEWRNGLGQFVDACIYAPDPGYPQADDKAIIPNGMCIQPNGTQNAPNEVGILEVVGTSAEFVDRGRVSYYSEAYLHIHCDSVVNGAIVFYDRVSEPLGGECSYGTGHLYLEDTNGDTLQIAGKGVIFPVDLCGSIEGDAGVELDLRNQNGEMTISGENQRSITIDVALRNRGVVTTGNVVQQVGGIIHLTGADKRGTGVWRAQNGGLLDVSAEVKGAGDWEIVDDDSGATIIFNEPCLDLSGDFSLHGGVLELYESICTTGHLLWTASTAYQQDGVILLHADTTAKFHGGGCP